MDTAAAVRRAVIVLVAGLGLGACRSADPAITAQPAPGGMADANIAGVVSTANQGEIEQGRIAASKAVNASVRQFGQRMVDEHTRAEEQLRGLLDRMNVAAGTNSTATQLQANARATVETLNALEGAAFDRTYIESQVALHDWLLRTLDDTLIPAATNDTLEQQLRTIRASVASHLEQARTIRSSLGN